MSVQETLGDAFEKIADIQNSMSDIKDIVEKIEQNNAVIGDVEDSVCWTTIILTGLRQLQLTKINLNFL